MPSSVFIALVSYLIGSINPSFLISKSRGFDIRDTGSGNAGASNAIMALGKKAGFFSMFFDMTKCYGISKWARRTFPTINYAYALSMAFCMLGHIYPFYMKFRGGKGMACLFAGTMGLNTKVFLWMFAVELIVLFTTQYIFIVTMTWGLALPLAYHHVTKDLTGTAFLLLVGVIIALKHRANIGRVHDGTEAKISFLWNKDAEIERLKSNGKVLTELESKLLK